MAFPYIISLMTYNILGYNINIDIVIYVV